MVEPAVEHQAELVGVITQKRQPAVAAGNHIKLIAVNDQQSTSILTLMHRLIDQLDIAQQQGRVAAQKLVVVTGYVHHPGATLAHGQHAAQHVGMGLRPVDALAQAPAVDDVTNQVKLVTVVGFEEGCQLVGLAATGAEVQVRDPQGSDALLLRLG